MKDQSEALIVPIVERIVCNAARHDLLLRLGCQIFLCEYELLLRLDSCRSLCGLLDFDCLGGRLGTDHLGRGERLGQRLLFAGFFFKPLRWPFCLLCGGVVRPLI